MFILYVSWLWWRINYWKWYDDDDIERRTPTSLTLYCVIRVPTTLIPFCPCGTTLRVQVVPLSLTPLCVHRAPGCRVQIWKLFFWVYLWKLFSKRVKMKKYTNWARLTHMAEGLLESEFWLLHRLMKRRKLWSCRTCPTKRTASDTSSTTQDAKGWSAIKSKSARGGCDVPQQAKLAQITCRASRYLDDRLVHDARNKQPLTVVVLQHSW
jgi:hypothetical protein